MTCPFCPLGSGKALEQVSAVQQVGFDYESKTATVQYDDAEATAEWLIKATTAAGYPSSVRGKER